MLGVIVVITRGVRPSRFGSEHKPCADSQRASASACGQARGNGSFPLRVPGAPACVVPDEDLDRFVGALATIYDGSGPSSPGHEALCQKIMHALLDIRSHHVLQGISDPSSHEPIDDTLFGRFLCATNFDVPQAAASIQAYLSFRRGTRGGVSPVFDKLMRGGAVLIPFADLCGRPVLVIRAASLDMTLPLEVFQRRFRASMDAIAVHLQRQRGKGQALSLNPLEQFLCIIDAEGAGWSNFSIPVLKMMVTEANVNFPERLQELLILGSSATIRAIWRVASSLLDSRTRRKVRLLARSEEAAALQVRVAREFLPPAYGGSGPSFKPAGEATNLEEAAGVVAASAWEVAGAVPSVEVQGWVPREAVAPAVAQKRGSATGLEVWFDQRQAFGGPATASRSRADCGSLVQLLKGQARAECSGLRKVFRPWFSKLHPLVPPQATPLRPWDAGQKAC